MAPKQGGAPQFVDANYNVDETQRYAGTVRYYNMRRGFGFITMAIQGVVPQDEVMVTWGAISSTDRWPALETDMAVEFGIKKRPAKGGKSAVLRADLVTGQGGQQLSLESTRETQLQFVGTRDSRYSGVVKFYDASKGFGYVTLNPGQLTDPSIVDVKLVRQELSGGENVRMDKGQALEFGLSMGGRNQEMYAYRVTLPGGMDLTSAVLLHRNVDGNKMFTGAMEFWHRKNGYGFVIPDSLNAASNSIKQAATKAASEQASKSGASPVQKLYVTRKDLGAQGMRLQEGTRVQFNVYQDDKGVGACNVVLA
jgi:cold shock CspA family protein